MSREIRERARETGGRTLEVISGTTLPGSGVCAISRSMSSAYGARSQSTLSANPCEEIQRRTRTPSAPILRSPIA